MAKKNIITTEWENIDSELAGLYLALNTENRPLSQLKVDEWAKEIESGGWRETHQGIAFDFNGKLIDGQHRLHAIVKAKKSVRILVTRGLDPASISVIDDGITRDTAALMTVAFKRRYGTSPANVRLVAAVSFRCIQGFTKAPVTKEESAEFGMKHFKLISDLIPLTAKGPGGSSHTCAAFVNACLYFSRDKIFPLAERYKSQMWAHMTDPLKALYNRFIKSKVSQNRQDRLDKLDTYAISVSAIRGCLVGGDRKTLVPTTQDIGVAEVDKRIRRGASPANINEAAEATKT